jgi:hypothetical protein
MPGTRVPAKVAVAVSIAAALALFSGCFEQPVLEILLFRFLPEGGATAALEVQIADPKNFDSAAVRRRMSDRQEALLSGADPWLDRFAAVDAASDGLEWRLQDGRLRSFSRSAEVDDPGALAALFVDDAATWSYERDGDRATLEIYPTRTSRASKRERDRTLREVARWGDEYASYVAAARAVDAFAAENPALAAAIWRAALPPFEREPDRLTPQELELADRLEEALAAMLGALEPDVREGTSLDERLRGAVHPFSAQIGIELPCRADEVEGFVEADEGDYLVPDLAIAEGVARLGGTWLAPDPLSALLERLRTEDAAVDPAPFANAPITTDAPAPDGAEVARAFLAAVKPPPVYRLVWSCLVTAEPAP